MATPTTAITRHDLSITYDEFSLMANRRGFIGLKVLPALPVARQSAQFNKVTVESVLGPVEDTTRAPKGTYTRDDFEWTPDSYATTEEGVEEVVDDALIETYGDSLRIEDIKRERAINRLAQAYEQAVASAVFDTATWTGASLTTAAATAWTTPSTAVPITDIDGAIESCKATSGMKPNALVLSDYALRKMKRCAQIQDLLKYSSRDDPKNLGLISGLQELFDLENILVGDGFTSSAKKGQDVTFSRLWNVTYAMVCHVATDQDLESADPCIGRTIMWTEQNAALPGAGANEPGVIVEEYREEERRGGVIRARCNYQVKIWHVEAGHLLTGVTA